MAPALAPASPMAAQVAECVVSYVPLVIMVRPLPLPQVRCVCVQSPAASQAVAPLAASAAQTAK